jgi:hypothetical protein
VTILYIETNFLIGMSTGRDHGATEILARVGSDFKLAIPGICFFEALSWVEGETKRRNAFTRMLTDQIGQSMRDLTSAHATSLHLLLSQARVENDFRLVDTIGRLKNAVSELARSAETIDLKPPVLERSEVERIIEERTDNLILHCVLDHARTTPSEPKLLLSGNTKEFGGAEVRTALREASVQYFAESQNVLGWLQAQTNS